MLSVVLATYNRGRLLDRSLRGYFNNLKTLQVPLEIIIIDDDSTDNTQELVSLWAYKLHMDIKYVKLFKKAGLWRDASSLINMGIRMAKGDLVIATHPEVIPGNLTLQSMWDTYSLDESAKKAYICSKIYYLSIDNQTMLDTVHWMHDPLEVRQLPNFYTNESAELRAHSDYSHESTDTIQKWDSWVFGGMDKQLWRYMGGFNEYTHWGSADVAFRDRRYVLGIKNITLLEEETFCIHQNHDIKRIDTDVLTPRNLESAMQQLTPITVENARLNHI